MDVRLYLKEGEKCKELTVPTYVVRDLLRDRLSLSEVKRIHRFAKPTKMPEIFKAGSVVVDFEHKQAKCFQAGLNLKYLEPTWNVEAESMTVGNY